MIIDSHAHIIVSEILREAAPAEEWRPRVVWEHDKQFVEYNGKRISSAAREFVSPEKIIGALNESGVDAALLCPWVSLARYESKPEESWRSCQIQNDALASLVKKYSKRIAALGLIPLQDVTLAIKELERAMKLGLKGIEVGTHVNGVYLGDTCFLPFWEACESLDAFVFIHPIEGGGRAELRDYYMWNVIGNPMETTIAAGHLILSGVMEKYPRLKILLAHGGGALPVLRGRLDRGFEQRSEIHKVITHLPSEYLKQFYFDTITHHADVLRNLVEFAGADHILLGSDYPFDMGNEHPVNFIHSAKLNANDEMAILGGNIRRLLDWKF